MLGQASGSLSPHYQFQTGGQIPTVHPELIVLVFGTVAQGSLELGAPDSASCTA